MVDHYNSMFVKPFKVERLKDKQGRNVYRGFTHTNDPRFPPERDHIPVIRPRDVKYKGKISDCPAIIVECTCLTGDTRVLTDQGYKTIWSLLNPFSNHLTEYPITYVINDSKFNGTVPYYTGKKPVWELELDNGTKIKASKDHKFLTYYGKKTIRSYVKKGRKQSGSLNNNSYIWKIESNGKTVIVEDMKAWCKNNGYVYSSIYSAARRFKPFKGMSITKWRKEPRGNTQEFNNTYLKQVKWVEMGDLTVGDRVVIHESKEIEKTTKDLYYWQSYFFGAFHGDGTLNPLSITCRSNPDIIDFFKKAGVVAKRCDNERYQLYKEARGILHTMGALNKRHYLNPDKFNIFGFLSGLLDSDGCLHDKSLLFFGGKCLYKVADRLKEIGVHGVKCHLSRKKGQRTSKGVATRNMYCLRISHEGTRQIIHNMDGDKIRKLDISPNKHYQDTPNTAKVKSIIYKGKRDVYDITVPKANRFVAESAIVHNCMRHMFVWEYADASRSDGLIWRGNGEPPLITNPGLFAGLCKHNIALGRWLVARGF